MSQLSSHLKNLLKTHQQYPHTLFTRTLYNIVHRITIQHFIFQFNDTSMFRFPRMLFLIRSSYCAKLFHAERRRMVNISIWLPVTGPKLLLEMEPNIVASVGTEPCWPFLARPLRDHICNLYPLVPPRARTFGSVTSSNLWSGHRQLVTYHYLSVL